MYSKVFYRSVELGAKAVKTCVREKTNRNKIKKLNPSSEVARYEGKVLTSCNDRDILHQGSEEKGVHMYRKYPILPPLPVLCWMATGRMCKTCIKLSKTYVAVDDRRPKKKKNGVWPSVCLSLGVTLANGRPCVVVQQEHILVGQGHANVLVRSWQKQERRLLHAVTFVCNE